MFVSVSDRSAVPLLLDIELCTVTGQSEFDGTHHVHCTRCSHFKPLDYLSASFIMMPNTYATKRRNFAQHNIISKRQCLTPLTTRSASHPHTVNNAHVDLLVYRVPSLRDADTIIADLLSGSKQHWRSAFRDVVRQFEGKCYPYLLDAGDAYCENYQTFDIREWQAGAFGHFKGRDVDPDDNAWLCYNQRFPNWWRQFDAVVRKISCDANREWITDDDTGEPIIATFLELQFGYSNDQYVTYYGRARNIWRQYDAVMQELIDVAADAPDMVKVLGSTNWQHHRTYQAKRRGASQCDKCYKQVWPAQISTHRIYGDDNGVNITLCKSCNHSFKECDGCQGPVWPGQLIRHFNRGTWIASSCTNCTSHGGEDVDEDVD